MKPFMIIYENYKYKYNYEWQCSSLNKNSKPDNKEYI
jgi:hypothetical protein